MTIAEICRLSDEVRSGELLISVFLDQVFNPDSKEADRKFVLRATYPTAPLRSLLEHVVQKLNGTHPKGVAVVCGTYGSGKSHALLALYHVVGGGEDGRKALREWGVKASLPDEVRVAPVQLRSERPDTLWELLFERAGRGDLNEQVRDYPTREQWAELGREKPTLLLVDELEDWFAGQEGPERAHTKNALANMLEAAQLPDVPLAVVLAVYGINDELMAIINRVQPPFWDVGAAEDRERIVRHRLIDDLDEAKARKVVQRYIETYERVRGELPSLSNLADLREEMERTYPFHPQFLRQAYQVYAAMPRHESTRGIVGACATLLRRRAGQRDIILTGDLDIADEEIASDLRKLDPDLVQNATEDLRERCAEVPEAAGIIGTALLYSFSPHGTPGATEEDVLIGNLRADGNINDLRDALYRVAGTPDGTTIGRGWFVDWENGRLVITKEVKLVNQVEQTARIRLETPEGREQAAERLREIIREAMKGAGRLILYPDDPLPSPFSGAALKYIVSLVPLSEEEALEILRKLDNTVVLLAPKPNVREKITADRDLLLRALRVLVCEEMLRQRGKRQKEVRELKGRYERELRQRLVGIYARWMRLSRINELGEEPEYVVRPVECELSVGSVEEKLREQYDVDAMRDGIALLLRHQGRNAPKGDDRAGLTIGQIRQGLQRERGLPILAPATNENFEEAIRRMVQDKGENGIVVQVGRVLYGYEETTLPFPLSDDWRAWLKPYAPEPPAKEDVKQRTRQELARAGADGITVRELKGKVTGETGAATDEVARAIVELVNENEAVVEQDKGRYPEDGLLGRSALSNEGRVWLAEHAPPDDRKARRRIIELVQNAGEEGIRWKDVLAHLRAEEIGDLTIDRAIRRLMADGEVECYDKDRQTVVREPGLLPPEAVLRLPKAIPPPPPPPGRKPLYLSIGPYRLPVNADLLMDEFRQKVPEGSHIAEVIFSARPAGDGDPLFGAVGTVGQLAEVQAEHKLIWRFRTPVGKDALINLVGNLLDALKGRGEVTLEATLSGEVVSGGA